MEKIDIIDYKGIEGFQKLKLTERIKAISKNHGVSIKKLAEKIGYSEQGLLLMFKKDYVKGVVVNKIADALKEPVEIFYQDDNTFLHFTVDELYKEIDRLRSDIQNRDIRIEKMSSENKKLERQLKFLLETDLIDFEKFANEVDFPYPEMVTTFPIHAWLNYFPQMYLKDPERKRHLSEFYTLGKVIRFNELDPDDDDLKELFKREGK